MKKNYPFLVTILFLVFFFGNLEAAPNKIENKKSPDNKSSFLSRLKIDYQKNLNQFIEQVKNQNGGK